MSFESVIAIGTPIAVITAAIIQGCDMAKLKRKTAEAAVVNDKKLNEIHGLVNSAMSVQLKITAVLARRLAGLTKDPADVKAAEDAEAASVEHDTKQAQLDRQKRASEGTRRYP